MRVLIDDEYLDEAAAVWWKKIPPAKRAVLIQALWECGHGDEDVPDADAHEPPQESE